MKPHIIVGAVAIVATLTPMATNASSLTPERDVGTADACYTWTRNLSRGDSGHDVKVLQVRLAGWVDRGENLALDGDFGSRTAGAVKRFKRAYGVGNPASGVAGPRVFQKLYNLQDGNCTPKHFAYSEFNYSCGENDFTGGMVSASKARRNIRRVMWQLEAMRKKLGGQPIIISSGFRSIECNESVGDAPNSLHMYGKAADLSTSSGPTLCQMARKARGAGFEEILGPGYPNHDDHTHVGNKSGQHWSAPNCDV